MFYLFAHSETYPLLCMQLMVHLAARFYVSKNDRHPKFLHRNVIYTSFYTRLYYNDIIDGVKITFNISPYRIMLTK